MTPPNKKSSKNINLRERLIFALDLPTINQAIALVDRLGDSVQFYKIGLELLMSGDYFVLLHKLKSLNKKVFADLKFYDIPQTVSSAVKNLSRFDVDFCTVHADNLVVRAACEQKGKMKILAVTVLTSHSSEDIALTGCANDVATTVIKRAKLSLDFGADGVISSGLEARNLRENLGNDFLIVSPGIRDQVDIEQKRSVVVEDAFRFGADYIVVGRPIRDAKDPVASAINIQKRIGAVFAEKLK